MSLFTGKTLMITGGTGSFGNAVLNRFLNTDIGEIRVFSRDEKKQDDMRHEFQVRMPEVADKISFYIGDVRDIQSCRNARIRGESAPDRSAEPRVWARKKRVCGKRRQVPDIRIFEDFPAVPVKQAPFPAPSSRTISGPGCRNIAPPLRL